MTQAIEIIPAFNVNTLKKAIDRLNRKAQKFGTSPLILTIEDTEPFCTSKHPVTGEDLAYEMVIEQKKATLDYEIPVLKGWELIARLDLYGDVVMVSAVPGYEVPEQYRNMTSIACDHCGHNRFRTHSIIIRHTETGEYKQVGSTCVKDFFAGHDPNEFMFKASILFKDICGGLNDEEGFGRYGSNVSGHDLETVLTITSAALKKWGWMSKGKAYSLMVKSTADSVLDNLYPSINMKQADKCHADESDKKRAQKAIEWWQTVEPNNDYLTNCVNLLKMGWVPDKYMGFACSMIPTAEREIEKAEQIARQKAEQGESNHVGQIGERIRDIQVKVLYAKEIDSDFGVSVLYGFLDDDGNVYKTFYSGSSWSAEKDDILLITGTVKKHDEFRGEKQTMLNRVAVKVLEMA